MIPTQSVAAAPPDLDQALEVGSVSGGQPTNPLWTSQVGKEDFRAALTQALKNAGFIAGDGEAATYRVDADLVGLEQPAFGIDFTVTATVT